jgi:hypothetical protein
MLQETWEMLVGIDKKRTIFIRGPMNRLELAYHVVQVNPKEKHVDSVAQHLVRMLEENNRCLAG